MHTLVACHDGYHVVNEVSFSHTIVVYPATDEGLLEAGTLVNLLNGGNNLGHLRIAEAIEELIELFKENQKDG